MQNQLVAMLIIISFFVATYCPFYAHEGLDNLITQADRCANRVFVLFSKSYSSSLDYGAMSKLRKFMAAQIV